MKLYRISTLDGAQRPFVAGFEATLIVRRTAPILKFMRGWSMRQVRIHCRRKHWTLEEVA